MSNEFNFSIKGTFANAGLTDDIPTQSLRVNQATRGGAVPGFMTVTTTEAAIPLTGISAAGIAWMKNCDTTHYIQIGIVVAATFYPVFRLYPLEESGSYTGLPISLGSIDPAATLYVKAESGTCELQVKIYER